MNKTESKIGFIGCGHMASAIIEGIVTSGFVAKDHVMASEINPEFAKKKSEKLDIEVITNNKNLVIESDVIFLAVKPNMVKAVLEEIKEDLNESKLVISIAAGVSTQKIENAIEKKVPVVRVMPNGPAMVLEGMSGIVKGKYATDVDVKFAEALLNNIGKCILIDEDKIDVLTAISGSGPAFFYKVIHEMALAGEKLGLDYDKAILLAAQTAIGSAKVMLQSDLTPAQLVDAIATKGGCTEVGVNVMNEQNTQGLFFEVIEKTAQKANDLGK